MRHEPHQAMRSALAFGPDHCPPDLFSGPVDAIVRGLKAHANHISHARHVAMEETYLRTRDLLGAEAFFDAAESHLDRAAALRAPMAGIGSSFAEQLTGPARDLAMVEWAWLEAHGAADAPAFDLAAIAEASAEAVVSSIVSLHPATRRVDLAHPAEFTWEGAPMPAATILVTRPRYDVLVTAIDPSTALLLAQLAVPHALGDLLERDPAATTTLVTAGALMVHLEIIL